MLSVPFICALIIVFNITPRVVKAVSEKLNDIVSDSPQTNVYDEWTPFARKLAQKNKEVNARIEFLENRTNAILTVTDNMTEGLIEIDHFGAVLLANKRAKEIFSVGEPDITQKNILEVTRDLTLMEKTKRCLEGATQSARIEKNAKSYDVFLSPVYEKNAVTGAAILFLDVTEKIKAEKYRREFSANVSHELKTPLTTIVAISEMFENGMVKKADESAFLKKITLQAQRLSAMVNDIIMLSEFDEDIAEGAFSRFWLNPLINSVVCSLSDKAAEKNVSVTVLTEDIEIYACERMLETLMYNLIDNGVKYNKQGGKIEISAKKDGLFLQISVCDTGVGIAPADLPRVFERFYRADKSRSKKTGGTGLGLSIVKHIAEFHGGGVSIESRINAGTRVTAAIGDRKQPMPTDAL